MFIRTLNGVKMFGSRLWIIAAVSQVLLLTADSSKPHRRSMPTQQSLPLSKGGWRPVVGSSGLVFNYGTAPLHSQAYKIPIPVLDSFPSSARPLAARDATKLTSIAQSYRPTTLRTVPAHPAPAASQPISSYLNPFALPANNYNYKYVQNFPADNIVIRNPHNPYAARPVFSKYPKIKQQQQQLQYQNYQQLTSVQPVQFGQYPTAKPLDVFGKPIEGYVRPDANKHQSNVETYKPEVFKLPDSDTAPQSVNQVSQQVKTAQQSLATPKTPINPYPQYAYQDAVLPPNIFGSFGSFGYQPVKGNHIYPAKTTYIHQQPSKQTLFNSFSFAPNFKTTSGQFVTTTPKLQTTANQIHFESTWNDYKNIPTQPTKLIAPAKIDPNVNKGNFKASPQDPFAKYRHNVDYKVSTYNPTVQTTTFAYNNYHDYNLPPQQNVQSQHYYEQQNNFNYDNKKSKIHDNLAAGGNVNQHQQQYDSSTKEVDNVPNSVPFRATYEVTENFDSEVITHSSPASWPATPESYKSTEDSNTKEFTTYSRPTTAFPDPLDEFAIVTEAEKVYENSLGYDNQYESQSRRPAGDDFEPIVKHKLKDYYYKVSTPVYDEPTTKRTKKKPTENTQYQQEVTTYNSNKDTNNNNELDILPTLPPNLHFRRPSTPEPLEKDKVRKRNKIRRRRPGAGNNNNNNNNSNSNYNNSGTRKYASSTTESTQSVDEVHTIRPRVRTTAKPLPSVTTPTVTTDLTTSALPTISPTSPTIVRKKLIRRPFTTTTTEKVDTTIPTFKDYDTSKDSPIMKISASTRPQYPKVPSYEYRTSETPDYTHKQDEKDTPTSDIVVSVTDSLRDKVDPTKSFLFHRDAKPIESKAEIVKETTTDTSKDSSEYNNEITTTTDRVETTSITGKISRPRLRNKYQRPKFSVKDYKSRLSSTTSTTERTTEANTPKIRYPHRRPSSEKLNDNETTTERKKFTPKDQRHKANESETNETTEKETHTIRPHRQREATEGTTQKLSSRIRNGSRRPKPTEETTETISSPAVHSKRPLRKKIKDTETGESVQDISVTETTDKNDITSERTRSESAIMKIADKKHQDHHLEHLFEHSKRVSDLTLAASKDYNTPGMFKTVSSNSRRIPNYFTIATDDPILPIEAFFPQLNQKKES